MGCVDMEWSVRCRVGRKGGGGGGRAGGGKGCALGSGGVRCGQYSQRNHHAVNQVPAVA